MATFTKTAVLLALALSAGSAFAAAKPATQTISTLGGKFTFSPRAHARGPPRVSLVYQDAG